ncbi:hypothetical protein [Streptomyces goshikiensis]
MAQNERNCPGWNEDCGNEMDQNMDLCPDCFIGRLDDQSPRMAS